MTRARGCAVGRYRPAKTPHKVLAFYKHICPPYPDHLRIYLVSDILSLLGAASMGTC